LGERDLAILQENDSLGQGTEGNMVGGSYRKSEFDPQLIGDLDDGQVGNGHRNIKGRRLRIPDVTAPSEPKARKHHQTPAWRSLV
jgi:hypothetical protein